MSYPEDWSAWRDERWFGRRPGENFRQRRVLYLMNQVGRDPGEVPCSEAIFLRSTDPNKIRHGLSGPAVLAFPRGGYQDAGSPRHSVSWRTAPGASSGVGSTLNRRSTSLWRTTGVDGGAGLTRAPTA